LGEPPLEPELSRLSRITGGRIEVRVHPGVGLAKACRATSPTNYPKTVPSPESSPAGSAGEGFCAGSARLIPVIDTPFRRHDDAASPKIGTARECSGPQVNQLRPFDESATHRS
jgi:hypothetical protein